MTSQPFGELSPAPAEALSIGKAAATYGLSTSTLRRLIKRKQLKAELRKGEKGQEYYFLASDLEALGYSKPESRAEVVQASRTTLELETSHAELAALRARIELLEAQKEGLSKEAALLRETLAETTENLRKAMDRIPLALPPAPPKKGLRKWISNAMNEGKPST